MVDLNNLSLDDLLASIKGELPPVQETQEAAQPVEEPVEENIIFEQPVIEEAVYEEPVSEEPVYSPPVETDYGAYGFISLEDEDEPENTPEPVEPVVYSPEKPIEVVFDGSEEQSEPLMPYMSEPVQIVDESDSEPIDYTPQPIEVIDEADGVSDMFSQMPDFDAPAAHEIYTPAAAQPEEQADGSFAVFGGINMDVDIVSMFPSVSENGEIVIENPESDEPEPSRDFAGQESPSAVDLTKTVAIDDLKAVNAVFERPGIVTGRNMFDKTADLSALPAILPADELLNDRYQNEEKTFVRTGEIPLLAKQKKAEKPDDGQMLLPGFGETPEAQQVDEDKVEDELKKNRSRKVGSFRLEGVEEEEPQLDSEMVDELNESSINSGVRGKRFSNIKTRTRMNRQSVEYAHPSDRASVALFIGKKKTAATAAAIISGACAAMLILLTAIPAVADKLNASVAIASLGDRPFTGLVSIVLLVIAASAGLPAYADGVTTFFNSGKPNSQTPIFLAATVSLIQTVLVFALNPKGQPPVFALAAAFIISLNAFGKRMIYTRVAQNFGFLVSRGKEGLYGIRTVDNAADAAMLGQNTVIGEAEIRYSGKSKFASNFIAYSLASDSADDLCVKLVPIVAVASVVIGIIAGFATKNVMFGFSLFSGALCMGAPASAVIAASLPLSVANKSLRADGAIVTSYASAFEYESTNAIAMDASELFPGSHCNIHGVKTFHGVRIDDSILIAASMLITAGGPISSLFNEVVMGRKELLHNVEELTYEDKLGLAGWIRGRRIFVGNRKLLENHNIEIPMSVDEARYCHDNRRVIYLADSGKLAAIFVVSYSTDPRIAAYLSRIESNGINILVSTTDSNITEEFVARSFGIPVNSVKVVSANVGKVLKDYSERVTPKTEAKIIHNGSPLAFLHSVSAASSLCSSAGAVSTQQAFCTAAGLLLMAIIVLFSGAGNVSALQVCICQAMWLAIGLILPLAGRD